MTTKKRPIEQDSTPRQVWFANSLQAYLICGMTWKEAWDCALDDLLDDDDAPPKDQDNGE